MAVLSRGCLVLGAAFTSTTSTRSRGDTENPARHNQPTLCRTGKNGHVMSLPFGNGEPHDRIEAPHSVCLGLDQSIVHRRSEVFPSLATLAFADHPRKLALVAAASNVDLRSQLARALGWTQSYRAGDAIARRIHWIERSDQCVTRYNGARASRGCLACACSRAAAGGAAREQEWCQRSNSKA